MVGVVQRSPRMVTYVCRGDDGEGQLGDGSDENSFVPKKNYGACERGKPWRTA